MAVDTSTAAPQAPSSDGPAPAASGGRRLGVGGWICAGWLILVLVVAVVAPSLAASPVMRNGRVSEACGDGTGLAIYDPLKCTDLKAKSAQSRTGTAEGEFSHLTGVDSSGRDVFSQVLFGARTTMIIAVVSIFFATLIGGALGLVAGYVGGRTDTVISGIFDVMLAFPPLILALLIVNTYAAIPDDPELAEQPRHDACPASSSPSWWSPPRSSVESPGRRR